MGLLGHFPEILFGWGLQEKFLENVQSNILQTFALITFSNAG